MNIKIISAGAGSGKTYTLTDHIHKLVKSGEVRPECIVATTFTKKAAAELRERVAIKLIEEGMPEQSDALKQALIGTVHSVGTRILQRFAFEKGYSPLVEIMPDGESQTMFNLSISRVLTPQITSQMQYLCRQLSFEGGYNDKFDWRDQLKGLADVIRINHLDAKGIQKSKNASWLRLESVLYSPSEEEAENLPKADHSWHSRLAHLLSTTIDTIEAKANDTTKLTLDGIEECRNALNEIKQEAKLPWSAWAKLSKIKWSKKSEEDGAALAHFCRCIEAHPRLRSELKAYIDTLFSLAETAIREFQQYKKKRGVIDYSDMEVMLDEALDHPAIKSVLSKEIDLLMVDEFQDTSPLQLSIFLKMSALAKKSIWVGDPKQSIYGFRGAEPALMEAVVHATGGVRDEDILKQSFRSRRDIVYAVNAIFSEAFKHMPINQVVLETGRTEPNLPNQALIHWNFRVAENEAQKPKSNQFLINGIAKKIAETLDNQLLVHPKGAEHARPIVPADIAVLCRTGMECTSVAQALGRLGIDSSMKQIGVNATTEGKFLLATVRLLVDKNDTLSLAEILVFTREMNLSELVAHRSEYLNLVPYDRPKVRWGRDIPMIAQLDTLRKRVRDFSPAEVLELLLIDTDFGQYLARFGNLKQRIANVEQFRASASAYELACARTHSAASLSGWLLWLNKQADAKQDNQSTTQNQDAVQIMTYHASKGLEFPMVVCSSLEKPLRESFWGITVQSDAEKLDMNHILKGRYLELRVHPYGQQIKKTQLEAAVQASPEYLKEVAQAAQEDARLLYVGLTRARDFLVLPSTIKPTAALNRAFNGADDIPTLQPDSTETPFYYPKSANEPVPIDLHITRIEADDEVGQGKAKPQIWLAAQAGEQTHALKIINTQTEAVVSDRLRQIKPTHFALPLTDTDNWKEADESAFLRFFQGDSPTRTINLRMKAAEIQLRMEANATTTSSTLIRTADLIYQSLGVQTCQLPMYAKAQIGEREVSQMIPKVMGGQQGTMVCYTRESIGDQAIHNLPAIENQLLWSIWLLGQQPDADISGGMILQLGQHVALMYHL
jgi:ATP-dependent helicase/nuclease subunit A